MSRLQNNMPHVDTPDTVIAKRLEPWINNPPEYETMIETYKRQGRLKALIVRKKREIERTIEELNRTHDFKPRSNDAKLMKDNSTSHLRDELADLEAELEVVEANVKALEFMKTMFNASNYRTRLAESYT